MPAARRLNLFDVAAIVAVASVAATAIAGYRRFNVPEPQISSVTPLRITEGKGGSLTVRGRWFHPYLHAYVFAAGRAPTLNVNEPTKDEAKAGRVTATELDLTLPAVTAGAYDLYLFNEFQQVAVAPRAFTVMAQERPRGEMIATVRFFVPAGASRLIAVGDRDRTPLPAPDAPANEGAEVIAIRVDPVPKVDMEMRVASGRTAESAIWIGSRGVAQQIDIDLRLPLTKSDGSDEWRYNGAVVRAGEFFALTTPRLQARGMVISVGEPAAAASTGAGRP